MLSEAFKEVAWMHAHSGRRTNMAMSGSEARQQYILTVNRARQLGDVLSGRVLGPVLWPSLLETMVDRLAEALTQDIVAAMDGLIGGGVAERMSSLFDHLDLADAENYMMHGYVTGRTSSSNPNISQRPRTGRSTSQDVPMSAYVDAEATTREIEQQFMVYAPPRLWEAGRIRTRPTRFKSGSGYGSRRADPEQRPIYAGHSNTHSQMRGTPNGRVWKPRGKGKHR